MSLEQAVTKGFETGRRQVVDRASRSAARAPKPPFQGYLVLEGDSWFSLPIYDEVTEALRKGFNYKTRSAAHHGDTAQEMAYLNKQLADLEAVFEELADDGHVARAILLSAGGNDVMDALSALMNAKGLGAPGVWHPAVVGAVLEEQVPFAIATLVARAVELSERWFKQKRPVILHGYGNPIPDGRGFRFGITLSGPWMNPVFVRKGYVAGDRPSPAELIANTAAMAELMKTFNDQILPGIVKTINGQLGSAVVHYVDVRPALTASLADEAYRSEWGDELHPTGAGFAKVAAVIHQAIVAAAPVVP